MHTWDLAAPLLFALDCRGLASICARACTVMGGVIQRSRLDLCPLEKGWKLLDKDAKRDGYKPGSSPWGTRLL